jgi:hypothetical protein
MLASSCGNIREIAYQVNEELVVVTPGVGVTRIDRGCLRVRGYGRVECSNPLGIIEGVQEL